MQIAIDGPAGAGKSTIAKLIAKKLDFLYLDTGAMYRAVTYGVMKAGIDFEDTASIIDFAQNCSIAFDGSKVFLNGEEVTAPIRTPEVSRNIHYIADIPEVRARLVEMQREIASDTSVIMDGRDIASVVLPKADVKIFLDAGIEERAKRRLKELKEKGIVKSLETLMTDMAARDTADRSRPVGALVCVPDAHVVDTTGLDIPGVCEKILSIIQLKSETR